MERVWAEDRITEIYESDNRLVSVLRSELAAVSDVARHTSWHGKSPPLAANDTMKAALFDKGNTSVRLIEGLIHMASNRNVLVIGDSIARDTYLALSKAYPAQNFLSLIHSGCIPADHVTPEGAHCFPGLYDVIAGFIAGGGKIDHIILACRYQPLTWPAMLKSIPIFLRTAPVSVVGVGPTFRMSMLDLLSTLPVGSMLPRTVSEEDRTIVPWSFAHLTRTVRKQVTRLGAKFINIHDDFCPNDQCLLWIDSPFRPLFGDALHMSRFGRSFLSDVLGSDPDLRTILQI